MAAFITEKDNFSRMLMEDKVKSIMSSSSYLTLDQNVKHTFLS